MRKRRKESRNENLRVDGEAEELHLLSIDELNEPTDEGRHWMNSKV